MLFWRTFFYKFCIKIRKLHNEIDIDTYSSYENFYIKMFHFEYLDEN